MSMLRASRQHVRGFLAKEAVVASFSELSAYVTHLCCVLHCTALQSTPLHCIALHCPVMHRFKEVLMLDCDVVPMRDPSYMFDAPEYRQAGNSFWGDIYGQ